MTFKVRGLILCEDITILMIKQHTVEKKNPKHYQVWEWEETPEVVAAIEQLQKSSQVVKDNE